MNKSEVSGVGFPDLNYALHLIEHDIYSKKLTIYFKSSCSLPFYKSYFDNTVQCVTLRTQKRLVHHKVLS